MCTIALSACVSTIPKRAKRETQRIFKTELKFRAKQQMKKILDTKYGKRKMNTE